MRADWQSQKTLGKAAGRRNSALVHGQSGPTEQLRSQPARRWIKHHSGCVKKPLWWEVQALFGRTPSVFAFRSDSGPECVSAVTPKRSRGQKGGSEEMANHGAFLPFEKDGARITGVGP